MQKFNFEGGGNRAKVEQIAVDLDGKFSTNLNIKNAPANYEEHFDFVPSVEEKTRMTMKIAAFEDFLNPKDRNGNLINKEMIVDFEKIPIATRDKLGFVIIGKNIEVDDSVKISSSRPNLISMPKNKLKNIFEEWRLRQ